MESNICRITKGDTDLGQLLEEAEKVATYNGLSEKNSLLLRLLAEELVSMIPFVVTDYSGEFWIVNHGNAYELCAKFLVEDMDVSTKTRLIGVSKNNRNSYAVGITGKIREMFDYMVMVNNDPLVSAMGTYGMTTNADFSHAWSLKQYQSSMMADSSEKEKWDEMERSILVRLADDVTVGVKGRRVSIIIKKCFA